MSQKLVLRLVVVVMSVEKPGGKVVMVEVTKRGSHVVAPLVIGPLETVGTPPEGVVGCGTRISSELVGHELIGVAGVLSEGDGDTSDPCEFVGQRLIGADGIVDPTEFVGHKLVGTSPKEHEGGIGEPAGTVGQMLVRVSPKEFEKFGPNELEGVIGEPTELFGPRAHWSTTR